MRTRLLTSVISIVALGLLAGCSSTDAPAHNAAAASTPAEAEVVSNAPAPVLASGEASSPVRGTSVIFTSDAKFRANQLVSGRPSIVAFVSPSCGQTCQVLWTQLEEIAPAYDSAAHLVVIDAFDNPGVEAHYGIREIPTLACFKNGALFKRRQGTFVSAAQVDQWVRTKCGIEPKS